ncbi:MAG: MFS transporter [Chloroflexi bacterium]|nr:MFS transporter [Chloroflexota bacterium]
MATVVQDTRALADVPSAAPAGTIVESAAGTTRRGLATFSSLRHRNYRYLWIGTLFMSAGQWVQQVTLGWLLYDLTGSSVLLGALNGLRALPFLVSGPIAGVVADRMDRRRLMLVAQSVLMVAALAMGGVVLGGDVGVWHLFMFTLVTGIAWSFNQPVRQTLVPSVVPKEDLANAIALNSAGFNLTKVVGPSLGGLLIASVGAGGNFLVQGVAYLGVLAMVYLMQVPPARSDARHASALANLKEGLAYVWSSPLVLALMLAALIPNIFAMPYQALMPVFQKDVLRAGPEVLGLMLAAPGVGAFLAMLFLASVADVFRYKGWLLLGGLVCLGISLIVFSQTTVLPLALVALAFVGGCQMLFMATTNTLLQLAVPDALRGRVMSIYMLDHGLAPAGALLAGTSTHFVGAPTTVAFMGIIVILLALAVGWRVPHLRSLA